MNHRGWCITRHWRTGYRDRQWCVYPSGRLNSDHIVWTTSKEVAQRILKWKQAGPSYRDGNRTTRKEGN